MSSNIDNRIVKLSFDNKEFEEGVSKSMNTLERLEEKLQFKKSAKGLSALQVGIDGVNFDELSKKIDKIEGRLSAFGIAGATIVQDITKSLINGVKKIEEATIGQITSGGWSRAMNLENAKFTIEGLGLSWQEMLKAINYGVQDTAYGLDAAATAASQLAASGVDYKESIDGANDSLMHTSLRAISGVAAMTNSSYEEISRIFATVAGQGAVMGDQLMQLASRGLNAAAIMAQYMGTSEDMIRDMASGREIDFETFATIMDEAFGEHAKEANKTFNGALSNMKAALSRFGAVFATPVVQNTNRFFIALTDRIKELKTMISDVTDGGEVLYEGLESHFAQMWSNLVDMLSVITEVANLDWFQSIANAADSAAITLSNLFGAVTEVWTDATDEAEKARDYSQITEEELGIVKKVLNGTFGNGDKRIKNVTEAIKDLNKEIDETNKDRELLGITTMMDHVTANASDIQEYVNILSRYGGNLKKAGITLNEFKDYTKITSDELAIVKKVLAGDFGKGDERITNINKAIKEFNDNIDETNRQRELEGMTTMMAHMEADAKQIQKYADILSKYGGDLKKAGISIEKVKEVAEEEINPFEKLIDLLKELRQASEWLRVSFQRMWDSFTEMVSWFMSGVSQSGMWEFIIDNWKEMAKSILYLSTRIHLTEEELAQFESVGYSVGSVLSSILYHITDALRWIFQTINNLIKYYRESGEITATLHNISDLVSSLGSALVNVLRILKSLGQVFVTAWLNVFSPASYTGRLAGLANIIDVVTGALVPSEEVLERMTEALTEVFMVIRNVKALIRSFLHSIMGAVTTFMGLNDETEEAGDQISAFGVILGGLLGIIAKVAQFLSGIPELIQAVAAQLRKDERIDHLVASLKALGDRIKDTDVFDKVIAWLEGIKDQAESVDVVMLIADAIGNLAEGLAAFIDKLPGWMDNIETFFKKFREVWDTFVTPLFGGENEKSRNQMSNPEKFAEQLGQDLRNFFTSLDLKSILAGGVESAAIVVLLQLSGLLNLATELFWIMDSIGYAVFRVIWKFGSILRAAKNFINALALTSVIAAIAIGMVAVASSIALLAQIPEDKLRMAEDVLMEVVYAIAALGLLYFAFQKWKFSKYGITAIQVRMIGMWNNLIDTVGTILMILAIGYALKEVIEALAVLCTALDGLEGDENVILVVIGGIFAFAITLLGIGIKGLVGLRAVLTAAGEVANAPVYIAGIGSIAAVLLSVGAAVWLIIEAFKNLNNLMKKGVNPDTWLALGSLLVIVISVPLIIIGLLTKMPMTPQTAGTLLSLAGIIGIMALGLTAIIFALWLLIPQINLMAMAGNEDIFIRVMDHIILMVVGLMAGIALLILAFTSGRSKFELTTNRKVLVTIASMMLIAVGAILVMAIAMGMLTTDLLILKTAGVEPSTLNDMMALMIAGLLTILLGIAAIIFVLGKATITPYLKQTMTTMTILMLAVAASLVIMAYAVDVIANALRKGAKFGNVITLFAIFAAMVTAVIIGAVLLSKKIMSGGGMGAGIQDALLAIVAAMLGISTALLIFAAAVWVIGEAPADGLEKMGKACIAFAIALAALVLVTMIPGVKTAFVTLGVFFVALGAGALLAGAGALALGAAMQLVNPLLPTFAIGLKMLLDTIHSRLGTFLIVSAVFVVIAALAVFFVDKISKALKAFFELLTALIGSIGGLLKSAGTGLMKWFRSMGPMAKVGVGILIAAVLSALSGQGPAILQTIGQMLLKIIDWLTEAIGPLAEKLVDLALKLIDGLINGLYDNIAVITALLKNLIITIFMIVLNIAWEFIGKWIAKLDKYLPDWMSDKLEDYIDVDNAMGEINEYFREQMSENTAAALEQRDALRANGSAFDKLMEETDKAAKKTKEMTGATNEANEAGGLLGITLDSIKDKCQDYPQAAKDAMVKAGKAAFGENGAFFTNLSNETDPNAISDILKKNLGAYGSNGQLFTIASSSASNDVDAAKTTYADLPDWIQGYMKSSNFDVSKFTEKFNLGSNFNMNDFFNGSTSIDMSSIMGENGMFDTEALMDSFGMAGEEGGFAWSDGVVNGMYDGQDDINKATNESIDTELEIRKQRQPEVYNMALETAKQGAKAIGDTRNDYVYNTQWALEGMFQALDSALGMKNGVPIQGPPQQGTFPWYADQIGNTFPERISYVLEVASPSKVMRRLAGHIIDGFTIGLDSGLEDVQTSSTNLSDTIISSFGNPLDYVSRVASGEIEYDPTIRPVFDGGDLATGITGINAMFDSQNVTLSGFSGKLAADISGLDTTNNQMVAEIRALRSDMNDMTDQITSMKIVMNSGQLVGAISKDMNRALGQDAIHRGRGL